MNQQQQHSVNLQNIAWKIKELTSDVPSNASDTINYETKTEMQIRSDLRAISIDVFITATDAKLAHPKPLAHLVLNLNAEVQGLEQFVNGNTANIPNEFAHTLVIMMSHTARGILMHAGRGTVLEQFPFPLLSAESIGQGTQQPSTRPN